MIKQVGNVQLMQKMNRIKVLNYIRQNPSVPRPVVAEATGLSLSSITNIIGYLMEKNLVLETGLEEVGRVGRKGVLLRFNSQAYNLICVHLDTKSIHISFTDLGGTIKAEQKLQINSQEPKFILDIIKNELNQMLTHKDRHKILAIGIAISGLVLDDSRFILSSSMKWKSINVKDELEETLQIPVFVENVSMTKAVWQFHKEEHLQNMLFVDCEDGIGAVQFYQGRINRSMIGEIGHTTVEKDGVPCFCGNRGCLEAMCSVDRIISSYQELSQKQESDLNFEILNERYVHGDAIAKQVFSECGEYLGIGLANLVNLLNPSIIILNGGAYLRSDFIYDTAISCMKNRAYTVLTQDLTIQRVNVGLKESVKGIATYLCDRVFDISFSYNMIE